MTRYKMKQGFADWGCVVFAVEEKAALRSIRVCKSDRFVKVAPQQYRLTDSNSIATYLIPDYMLDEVTIAQ